MLASLADLLRLSADMIVQVDSRWAIPMWTIALTGTIDALLGLIQIGSSVAFNAIVSLVVSGYLSSHLIPIILIIRKRKN